jgi:SH3-like domain-containing protein
MENRLIHRPSGLLVACFLAAHLATGSLAAKAQAPTPATGEGSQKRYVSLKSDRVQLREGPGAEYPTTWVFRRTGLPVEVLREHQVWREIRDSSGTIGWVHSSLLSRRRTALVLPWEIKEQEPTRASVLLHDDDSGSSNAIARVEAGTLVSIISCENGWCRISIGDYRGFVEQSNLWGTNPNELIR